MHSDKTTSVHHVTNNWAMGNPGERLEVGDGTASSDIKLRSDLCEFCRNINFTAAWKELSETASEGLGLRPDKSWNERGIEICTFPRGWPAEGSYCRLCRIGTCALNGAIPDHSTPLKLSMYTLPPDGGKPRMGLELRQEHSVRRSWDQGENDLMLGIIYSETSIQMMSPYLDYDWLRQQLRVTGTTTRRRLGSLTEILLFDCKHLVPVQACTDSSYVALSYVIGPTPWQPERDSNGLKLTMEQLPVTIRDAVHFTRALGEQFLWVDALCIPPIDGPERRRQLALMADIYSQARVILVSLGDNHDCPIPGVTAACEYESTADTDLGTICLSPEVVLDIVTSSAHNTRGWALQETLLSRTVLYSLQCGVILAASEDKVAFEYSNSRMIPGAKDGDLIDDSFHFPQTEIFLTPFTAGSANRPHEFDAVFKEYCSRSLTHESDSFDAFRGYLSRLPWPSLWGIVCDMSRSDYLLNCDLALESGLQVPYIRTEPDWDKQYNKAFLRGLCFLKDSAPPAAVEINLVSAGSNNGQLVMAPSWSWVSKRHWCFYGALEESDITVLTSEVSIVAPDGSESSCAAFFSNTADGRLKSEQVRLLRFHAPLLELRPGPLRRGSSNIYSATVISESFATVTSGLDVREKCYMDTRSWVTSGSFARVITLATTTSSESGRRLYSIYGLIIQRQSEDRWKRTGLLMIDLTLDADRTEARWRERERDVEEERLFDQVRDVLTTWPRQTIILE